MKKLICLLLSMLFVATTFAQNKQEADLAEQYFIDDEFESALELYTKLFKQSPEEPFALRIVGCYENLGQFEEAIKFIDKQLKRKTAYVIYPFLKAQLLEKTGEFKDAEKLYKTSIEKDLINHGHFIRVGSFLYQAGRLPLALDTYLQGRKRLKDKYLFNEEVANIHLQLGDYGAATEEYLSAYYQNPGVQSSVNLNILNMVQPDSQEEIEQTLLKAVDKRPNDEGLRTMLFEFYVLAENFYEAFIQVKAADRLFKGEGDRVFSFGKTMRNNKRYSLSNKAFEYIIEKRKNSGYYFQAHMEKAINSELEAFEQLPVDRVAIDQAVKDYGILLDEFGRNPAYFDAIIRRARLLVFYLFDLDLALSELRQITEMNLGIEQRAEANLLIGDILLMKKEYNEAKVTYTQVSQRFRDRQLGTLAKFKLAELAYYKGEFSLAEALLSAIKDNTDTDISNDAIRLNLIIIDNTGLDTTTTALEMFANAQLLVYQRNYAEAMVALDSLAFAFPNHSLADEILWEKAQLHLKQNEIQKSLEYIDRVLNQFSTDIYGDDALYTKARIYDYNLKDQETAVKHYLEFLTLFPGSLYSVEVRKRVRALRKT